MRRDAILLATTVDGAGVPTAVQGFGNATVLARLLDQLSGLGVEDVTVITRPGGLRAVTEAVSGHAGVDVLAADDLAGDLLVVADAVAAGTRPLTLVAADLVTHREALAGLLADPRIASGALTTADPAAGSSSATATAVRVVQGRVVSGGSPFHRVGGPNGRLLDVVSVRAEDRPQLVVAARALAAGPALAPAPAGHGSAGHGSAGHGSAGHGHDRSATDALALLLVGLVRSGVRVSAVPLRGFLWARPVGADELGEVERTLDSLDEDRILLDTAVKADDGFYTTFLVSPYSRYLARWAARRGLTPNQVTVAALAVSVLAAVAFGTGTRAGLVVGAVLFLFSFTLDCVDGQLARYTRRFTPLGAWLDAVFDRMKEFIGITGLAIGSARAGDGLWTLAAAVLVLQTVRHLMDFGYSAVHGGGPEVPALPLDVPEDGVPAAVTAPAPTAPAPTAPALTAPVALGAWQGLDRRGWVLWAKRIAIFPIGERFAVIALTAALFSPRVTMVTVLVWGALAFGYGTLGRCLRSLARRDQGALRPTAALDVYRDDGPLASVIAAGRSLAPGLAVALAVAGAVPVATLAASGHLGEDTLVTGVAVAWFVVTTAAAGRGGTGRLSWLVPPVVRATEYTVLLALAVAAGGRAVPVAFALICALAFHHYETVYRLRLTGSAPPRWVGLLAGGWELRVLGAFALAVAGPLTPGYLAAAVLLGALFVVESTMSWVRGEGPNGRSAPAPSGEEEMD
ncbi:MAG: CDP-alcohol phosphatidyltransferase family protein [Actinomycetales bacterium]|nr:CDP-alcohol phosphatidyltransferase family protein [Actinomycetales bacterium]